MSDAVLIPLQAALKPYSVPLRTGRRKIKQGELPASKPGREWLVNPDDVARLFAPTLRAPQSRSVRESETARAERQLREAGIV
ncbi:MAG: hypothetical protein ABSC94_30570 [Polyangiaceae bacterium]|jgi:excisionase family DNA binding protein